MNTLSHSYDWLSVLNYNYIENASLNDNFISFSLSLPVHLSFFSFSLPFYLISSYSSSYLYFPFFSLHISFFIIFSFPSLATLLFYFFFLITISLFIDAQPIFKFDFSIFIVPYFFRFTKIWFKIPQSCYCQRMCRPVYQNVGSRTYDAKTNDSSITFNLSQ